MNKIDLSQMSEADLQAALEKKQKDAKAQREKERKDYESSRDKFVHETAKLAIDLNKDLCAFKGQLGDLMDSHEEKLREYGKISANSKGGFSVQDSTGEFRVKRIRATEPQWDERSSKAITLIKEFLADTVKKKDLNTYEVLISFMARNANGDLQYQKVMDLLQHEERWDDPRWVEGLKLIKESYSIQMKAYQFLIYRKNEEGKWVLINLNFSAV